METKREMLAVTVTMSGLLIFKGAQNGRIANIKLTTFTEMGFYAMQKAGLDESLMVMCVEKCLLP